jgi:hypothetical protein
VRGTFCLLLVLSVCSTAAAASLPGVKTPSKNISCFYVPIKPTARGNLLCDIKQAGYIPALQTRCGSQPIGLDWHGFTLPQTKKAQVTCSGGILYDVGRDTPKYVTLGYGRTWRYRGFACTSRVTGLTCANRAGHGLFLSRASYRLW